MIDSVPLIQNPNDAQQINASIIAMKKASRELNEKIVKLNSLNSELDKKIALLDSGLNKEIEDRKEAINSLDVSSVGGSGKYISAISETDGKISATVSDLTSVIESGNNQPVTSDGVAGAIQDVTDIASSLPTDAVLHYSFDEVPDYPDGTSVYRKNNDFTSEDNWKCGAGTVEYINGIVKITITGSNTYLYRSMNFSNCIVKIKFKASIVEGMRFYATGSTDGLDFNSKIGENELVFYFSGNCTSIGLTNVAQGNVIEISEIYIGNGSYSTPIIDNANGQYNAVNNGGIAVNGVSGKAIRLLGNNYVQGNLPWTPYDKGTFTVSCWVKNWNKENGWCDIISNWSNYMVTPLWLNFNNTTNAEKAIRFDVPNKNNGNILRYCVNKEDFIWNNFNTDLMHVVAVFNASNSALYINGQKINLTFETAFNLGGANRKFFYIGRHAHEGNVFVYTKATFDDFLVFDRALSETEVQALYQNKANTPKYYDINNYNLKQIKDITAQSTDFADFQSRMAGLATRSLQVIEPTEDER